MFDQGSFARSIPLVHGTELWNRHVRLVDDDEEVIGEVVDETVRCLAGATTVHVTGVVLDATAKADLLHHLEVERGAHTQALSLEQLAFTLELPQTLGELFSDRTDRVIHRIRARDVVGAGKHRYCVEFFDDVAGERMQGIQRLDLVAEHLDADRQFFVLRDDLDRVTAHPEVATGEIHVVAVVLHRDEFADECVPIDLHPDLQRDHRLEITFGTAETVDARHRRHDDDVAAAEQRIGGGVPQPLDLGVDRGVFLDECVGLRHVRLRLVVVVIGDEVLDRVVGHQLAKFVGQLRGESLVVREHQGGALYCFDEPRGGRRLTCSGGAQQHHIGFARVDAGREFGDGRRLIAARRVVADDLERPDRARGFHIASLRRASDITEGVCRQRNRMQRCRPLLLPMPAPTLRRPAPGCRPSTRRCR